MGRPTTGAAGSSLPPPSQARRSRTARRQPGATRRCRMSPRRRGACSSSSGRGACTCSTSASGTCGALPPWTYRGLAGTGTASCWRATAHGPELGGLRELPPAPARVVNARTQADDRSDAGGPAGTAGAAHHRHRVGDQPAAAGPADGRGRAGSSSPPTPTAAPPGNSRATRPQAASACRTPAPRTGCRGVRSSTGRDGSSPPARCSSARRSGIRQLTPGWAMSLC